MQDITNIREASKESLIEFFNEIGEKPFRLKQLDEWIWAKGINSFEEISNFSDKLKNALSEKYYFNKTKVSSHLISKDSSEKICFMFSDGKVAEGVLILNDDGRTTACISTQSGCPLNCKFCATGKFGYHRNLFFEEIFDQVFFLNKLSLTKHKRKLSNIVFMGMGEPLLNYDNLIRAIDIIISPKYLGFCASRITVSTVGIVDKIKLLADYNNKINLAVSLHATDNISRSRIIPVNEKHNIEKIIGALNYFYNKSGNLNTIEYILFKDFNDSPQKASELAELAFKSHSKINIIQFNPVENTPFQRSENKAFNMFIEVLKDKQIVFTIRYSKGEDINAACGQLASKITK
ncbi:MAG: 23S rRNA (adenine(2503)-C(2))-methyltransferase [Bacteroidetes bacterium GWE2_29_8]|nr:MAG: 23S rRNA (adenine(2503)-C(2))-methyltransferase [Bacteroidetes bacterium GWE2_29_8]OFY14605.1 MAG: 23S rRNA (adenine(2503)-C(2))-methyltransferase [Bacteroidetes bacterium GWF2_29_10]